MPRGEDRELPFRGNPRRQRDYKPPVPSTDQVPTSPEEASVDDYRTRKQKYQESLGVSGRKEFRRGLNERWDDIARQLLSGTPLEQLIEPWGEGGGPREGRRSVAWDQWTKGLNPGLQRAVRTRDMFQGAIQRGRVKEWPPGSGRYYGQWFSDRPQYYDALGNPLGNIAPPPPSEESIAPITPTAPPINPNEITSGGLTYAPPPEKTPPTGPIGPPVIAPSTGVKLPSYTAPSYLTGSPSQPQPWHGYNTPTNTTTRTQPMSPYSQGYNPLSKNAKGPQYRRPMIPWRF